MKIERIKIEGLWHEFNIDWSLYPDVNILVGGNGSGKSTVLDLIHTIMPPFRMGRFFSHKAKKKMIYLLLCSIIKHKMEKPQSCLR